MTPKITEDQAGTWLDGALGWHNHYRVVDRAQEWGWTVSPEDQETVDAYRADRDDPDGILAEAVTGQGGLVERATDYLDSLAPEGMAFNWDMGELSLLCLCQIEGTEENEALMKSGAYQCARCDTQ